MRAVSLFSNCGAGDVGFKEAGFRFDVMSEIDERRLAVALLNHTGAADVPGDLRRTWPDVVAIFREKGNGRPALLSSCPPCQGMSSARSDRGMEDDPHAGARDPRNLLVLPIAEVAAELEPRVVVVENVRAFLTKQVPHPETGAGISAAKLLISMLEADYQVFPLVTDLCDYGVPQSRKRAFLTFIRHEEPCVGRLLNGTTAPYPIPTHAHDHGGPGPVNLGVALAEFALPPLDARTEVEARAGDDYPLHFVPVWQDRRHPMVAAIPPDSGLSAWENNECGTCGRVDITESDAVCPRCSGPLLRPVMWQDGSWRLVKGFHSSYRRMDPGVPAATVATSSGHLGSDRTVHPSENRLLSPLECQLLQTFPEDFDWGDALEEVGHTNIRAMIGEAVPPHFTRMHGEVLAALLAGEHTGDLIGLNDLRCTRARDQLDLSVPCPVEAVD